MPNTYTLIASSTVGSGGAATIDFTSIPQTYTDLCLKMSVRQTANGYMALIFNGSSASNNSMITLRGTGSAANSFSYSAGTRMQAWVGEPDTATASTFGNLEIYIPNYAGSTNKSVSVDAVSETDASAIPMTLSAGLWGSTAAITSISFTYDASGPSANYMQNSTAYLYGIKNS